ncbi:pilus assembly protein PilP [Tahibacter soli]|uniref:Pilus assembly protein PilP n=1 Tax=Tahibacter soli TaxID=2983605 RepID=A0A9X4BJ57_9GAMM|nr:pilus assembly protein PilP [Tahibacter soli]MDC8014741.1 pilus assembly protein PilP [Tahibacter soli]
MMRMRIAGSVVLAALVLTGCTAGRRDLEDWVAAEKAKKGAPIEPLPTVKTFETFEYKDQEMRDPFSPSAEEARDDSIGTGPRPDDGRVKEALESFPLDGLAMVGTIGVGDALEGLVKDPDGVVHRVHQGNYLGQNYGKITLIAEDRVEVVELVPNGAGGWMERQASIALGDK